MCLRLRAFFLNTQIIVKTTETTKKKEYRNKKKTNLNLSIYIGLFTKYINLFIFKIVVQFHPVHPFHQLEVLFYKYNIGTNT